MIPYPHISPAFLKLGNLELRWYGLMYALAFVLGYFILRYLLKKTQRFQEINMSEVELLDLLFWVLLGVLLGGRLGYVLFYNLGYYLQNPLSILAIWEGGMSFHGGLLGVALVGWLFCRAKKIPLLTLADLLVIPSAIGLGLGRIGNFINGELYGRVTDVPWCMQFPNTLDCRHPSQLYEFLLEGVVLFTVLWILKDKKLPRGGLFWIFLALYGVFRFIVEFFRQPDPQLGLLFGILTMGQLLSIPLILIGAGGFFYGRKYLK